ncbi:MAG TPA: sigma 54-interacting transcriptional regulator [Blastocatellia bacterium]|nr:sigma 54-interacting transcriptional regulator [Blastocatellia bacterium]
MKNVQTADVQSRQYSALLELSKAIASHESTAELFRHLEGPLHRLLDFHSLGLIIYDPRANTMRRYFSQTTEPAMEDLPDEIPVETSVAGWVWRNQQAMLIHDVESETRFDLSALREKYPVLSLAVTPLTTANQRLGALYLASEKTWAYASLDLEFAALIAGQIAVAVEAQCYQCKLARERDRSQLLLEVNNLLVSNLNLQELLSSLSACLHPVIKHDLAGLALYEGKRDILRVAAVDFPSNETLFAEGEEFSPEVTPVGQAFRTRKVVISGPVADDPLGRRAIEAGVKSGCIVPLVSRDRTLGILSLGSLSENAFTDEDAEVLEQLGKQVAIAVENAMAFRKIEELKSKLNEERLYLEEEIRSEYNFEEIIGSSPALRRVLQDVETVAATDSTVLIFGETGTGKELVARAIHNLSARRERTLVKVNCGAIPTGLLESEMFGHEKGAFTGAIERRIGRFELAHDGTIFLDEIEDIPLDVQPKLLRVLQEQEFERLGSSRTIRVNVRVVAATNSNLNEMVAEKKFRSDLFYRLNVVPISLPPLRDRRDDIPLLVQFFTQKFANRMKKPIESIPRETLDVLTNYSWPGNIRELQNMIERAVTLSRGRSLEVPLTELTRAATPERTAAESGTLEAVEREHILRVLEEVNWVIGGSAGAAARLGLPRTTLNSRMRSLGIVRPYPRR